jgi:anti-sigma factor RsiW
MNGLNEADRIAVMAYVDGELPQADRAALDARLAHEPALATAVARERALRAALQSAYAPVLDEPVPAALLDLLAMPGPDAAAAPTAAANDAIAIGANDAHRAKLAHARRWQWPQWAAMAACLVLGVLVGTRALAPGVAPPTGTSLALAAGANGTITAQGRLREALEQRTGGGGDKTASDVAVGLSFRNQAQQYCRTFTLAGASAGIACKQDDGWVVAQLSHDATAAPASATLATGSYRMAASPYSPALLQAVDAMRVGDTLDAAAESAARAKGWKP